MNDAKVTHRVLIAICIGLCIAALFVPDPWQTILVIPAWTVMVTDLLLQVHDCRRQLARMQEEQHMLSIELGTARTQIRAQARVIEDMAAALIVCAQRTEGERRGDEQAE